MKYIKKFFNKKIYINIIDAIALSVFSSLIGILKLLRVDFNHIYVGIVFLVIWAVAKIVFMRHIVKRESRD